MGVIIALTVLGVFAVYGFFLRGWLDGLEAGLAGASVVMVAVIFAAATFGGPVCPEGETLHSEFQYLLPLAVDKTTVFIPVYRYWCAP